MAGRPMKRMDRRRFVIASAATAASWKSFAPNFTVNRGPSPSSPAPQLARPPTPAGPVLPQDVVGRAEETQQRAEPRGGARANTGRVAQGRAGAPNGGGRRGGN